MIKTPISFCRVVVCPITTAYSVSHCVPALEILTAAMDRVRVPQAFGAAQSSEDSLLSAYRRLDPSAQGLVSMTAERLAAG